MPDLEELEQYTARDAFEGRLDYNQRERFEARQQQLATELAPEMESATAYAWSSPEHFSEVLTVMEYFGRKPGQLGVGAENALLLYQKFGLRAKFLIESRETTERGLYKQAGSFATLLYKYDKGKVRTYRTIIKAFDISQLKNPPAMQEPPVLPTPLSSFIHAVNIAQKAEGFVTTYDSNWTHAGFSPAADDESQPPYLVVPAELDEQEFRREAMYCFTLYEMSKKEGFSQNPETQFIARCAANIACMRFGWEPAPIRTLPTSVNNPGEKRSLLNRVYNTSDSTLKRLNALINSGVAQ